MRKLLTMAMLITTAVVAEAPPRFQVENDFAKAYMTWGKLRESTPPGTLNVQEIEAWKDVKAHWKAMSKYVEAGYQ